MRKESKMRLDDVAMVAADTSRSKAYVQALIRNHLLPSFILILGNKSDTTLPGQVSMSTHLNEDVNDQNDYWSEAHFNLSEPIQVALEASSIPYEQVEVSNIHDPSVIEIIQNRSESTFIYSGYGGIILRKELFLTGKQFLHVHGGYLADYKGSTTNYYSLIVDNNIGASSLFLNEDIDGGPVLLRKKFPPPEDRTRIDHIYDNAARAKVLVETLQEYKKNTGEWPFEKDANAQGETYFIIHPVLKHIAILAK
jgi:methionyl-tRNA formyltransferase